MPARAIEVSFCGAATTASTSPASAALIAISAKASEARPLAATVVPKSSAAKSGCAQSSTLTQSFDQSASPTRPIARMAGSRPHARACRSITPISLTTIGRQALRTAGSSAALRLISGPMPAGSPVAMAIFARLLMTWALPVLRIDRIGCGASALLPGHERRVDHVRYTVAAHGPNGEVHVLQSEFMGRNFLQGKTVRGQLLQGKLAGLEAVPACALYGDELHRDLSDREVGEFRHFTLNHDRATLALERLHAEQYRDGPGARGTVESHIHALAAGDLHDARQRILLLDVDHVVGAELLRDLHPCTVLGRAGDDDERGAGLLADHRLRQPLLTRALDEHGGIIADATVEQRPFNAVRHRRYQPCQFRGNALGDAMHDGIPRKIDVLREAAPEVGRPLGGRIAVTDGIRVVTPVGVLAVAVLAEMAPLALAAGDIVLHEYQVALLEALASGELAAGLG